MKIRKSFVTNSSSSSFIITICDDFPDVFTVAEKMIPCRCWEDDDDLVDILDKSTRDRNTSVFFRSCNYDTYIVKNNDKILIDTCNNHSWDCFSNNKNVNYGGDGCIIDNNKYGYFYFVPSMDKKIKIYGEIINVPREGVTIVGMFKLLHQLEFAHRHHGEDCFLDNGKPEQAFDVHISDKYIMLIGKPTWGTGEYGNSFDLVSFLDELKNAGDIKDFAW